ncbi:MAG TPA: glycosyltransferase family 87 protein, partial [Anaerolineales bacterium]
MKTGIEATIMAWNPPSLFVFLLPLSWLPFDAARVVLLIINLIIISAATLMLSHLYLPVANAKFVMTCLIFAFVFPPVVAGIFAGQVTFFVFLGLVSCVMLIKRGQWFWAGAALILVTIKPQLVILSVIYLLVYMAQKRQFQGWLGLLLAGIFCSLVLFVFRPAWISDLIGEMAIAPVHWFTPTIGGLLSHLQITEATRSLILLFLPLPFL